MSIHDFLFGLLGKFMEERTQGLMFHRDSLSQPLHLTFPLLLNEKNKLMTNDYKRIFVFLSKSDVNGS